MRGFKMRKFEFKLFRGKKMISRARSFKTHQKSAEEQLDKKEDWFVSQPADDFKNQAGPAPEFDHEGYYTL